MAASDWVLDASVAVKFFVAEPDSAAIVAKLKAQPSAARRIVPSLLRYELGSACVKRGVTSNLEPALREFFADLEVVEPRDPARFTPALSYYDASYLALAVEQDAGLLTTDEKMRKAARKHGIEVWP